MKKIVLMLAKGFEEIEALTVVDILRRVGVDCKTCSITEEKMVKGTHNIYVKSDIILKDFKEYEFSGIVLPGGMPGATNLRDNKTVIEIIKEFNEENKLIAAICAAPIVLKEADIIKNKNITSYPGFEEELKGCNYKEDKVVQNGNIITSRGPSTAIDFAFKILENIIDEKELEELKKSMLYL
ncbi:DJ-1 family glyoxalase III [Clostridium tetani]|uniref:DJ-1 family glyoxalase III n=1 Tax=Clostridium tetani TaxID=1513 RepID=UPI0003C0D7FB|nr:DJ-1 family glyoxalase III [Clostridium tetani]KHO38724.1 thiamine biosynthesis protein ThiJ [Clostridium tetani]CDI49896.1 4-methyl-5(B-hydroxyethyl)-thiazolemonophosphate biosynthesis enzyme [Clostridium tetani 12124569]